MNEATKAKCTEFVVRVDRKQLFDALQAMGGDFGPAGERIVQCLLAGQAGFVESVGLAVYGIEIHLKDATEVSDREEEL